MYGNGIGGAPVCVRACMYVCIDECFVYDIFYWQCNIPEIHQIVNLKFFGTSRYKFKLRFWFNSNLHQGILVPGFWEFQGCSISVESVICIDEWVVFFVFFMCLVCFFVLHWWVVRVLILRTVLCHDCTLNAHISLISVNYTKPSVSTTQNPAIHKTHKTIINAKHKIHKT